MNRALKAKIIQVFGSNVDFARVLGLREDRLSRIIHGRTVPRDAEIKIIAEKLAVAPSEIFPN